MNYGEEWSKHYFNALMAGESEELSRLMATEAADYLLSVEKVKEDLIWKS
jgi:hypothetical protein